MASLSKLEWSFVVGFVVHIQKLFELKGNSNKTTNSRIFQSL